MNSDDASEPPNPLPDAAPDQAEQPSQPTQQDTTINENEQQQQQSARQVAFALPPDHRSPKESGANGISGSSWAKKGNEEENKRAKAKVNIQKQKTAARVKKSTGRPSNLPPKWASNKKPPNQKHLVSEYLHREAVELNAIYAQEDRVQRVISDLNDEIRHWQHWRRLNRIDPGWIYGQGFAGYGQGWTSRFPGPKLVPPAHRKRPGNRKTRELRVSKHDLATQADLLEDLVPIRLDIEFGKLRLRDTFTWNLYDKIVTPQVFAEGLVEDLKIPPDSTQHFAHQVYNNINEQIGDFHPHPFTDDEPLDPHLPYFAYKNDEMRILIKLNITIGRHNLTDQFDWDINNKENSPEEFASRMAYDLCLSGEFTTAIAHSIREQTQLYTKSLYMADHPFDGRPVENFDVRDNLLSSPLTTVFRPYQSAKDFAPYFYELKDAALDRAEDAFEREQRQQKRSVNRKGGRTLPDLKERLRTVRTLLVSDLVPGASENIDECGIYKPTRTAMGRGRRSYRADRGDESDLSETGDSDGDSPSRRNALQGTARTRGMRGAASAAQAAMRANLADSLIDDQFESRSSRKGDREDSASEPSLIVRLKISRERYRRWFREYDASHSAAQRQQEQEQRQQAMQQAHLRQQQQHLHQQQGFQPNPQQFGMPLPSQLSQVQNMHNRPPQSGFGRSPSTDAMPRTPQSQQQQQRYTSENGAVNNAQSAPPPPTPPPAPPAWLYSALNHLRTERASTNPEFAESFSPVMRWHPQEQVFQPRIRCYDCRNRILYRTEEHDPVGNFRQHLATKEHKENAAAKKRG